MARVFIVIVPVLIRSYSKTAASMVSPSVSRLSDPMTDVERSVPRCPIVWFDEVTSTMDQVLCERGLLSDWIALSHDYRCMCQGKRASQERNTQRTELLRSGRRAPEQGQRDAGQRLGVRVTQPLPHCCHSKELDSLADYASPFEVQ